MKQKVVLNRGSISILVLVFGVVGALLIGGLVVLVGMQFGFSHRNEASEKALAIAEAGVQYYRWHLAHEPEDYTDGTGEAGPYVHEYKDPQGDVVGHYSLEITPPEEGESIVTIKSTGWTNEFPLIKRAVTVTFGIPSLAQYSFLHNANVWFGSGLTVHGRVLSNGGVRQDGVNDSIISSAKEVYTCGYETGCSPSEERPGVWGSGGPSELWDFPVVPADFDAINIDFNTMKQAAEANGVYLPPSSEWGYHLVFRPEGTVEVYEVRRAQRIRGYDSDEGCSNLYQRIQQEHLIGSYPLEENKIIFAEDTLWVEGIVNGRVTVVGARFPIGANNVDVWIPDSIAYNDTSGNDVLGIIAQRNIYFGRDVPDDFVVHAALLAQSGKIIRHHYRVWWCGNYSSAVRDSLTVYGSIISNQKSYWNWGSDPDSGFVTRNVSYDSNLYLQPPPYFPAEGDYEFITWEESDR